MIGIGPDLPTLKDLTVPLDGYVRVSRVGDRAGESYISPDVQRRAIEAWAASRGVRVSIHEPEENVSGGTMDRPVFNRIMERIRDGRSGGLVVYKLDRFSRTMLGGLTTLQELAERQAVFASATEPLFDFTSADGRMFMQMNLMMAEYFRERTREGWATALGHAVDRGVHIAPTVPYGYVKAEGKRLAVAPAGRFVTEAFERRRSGWSYQRIAEWLNAEAPRRVDGRDWIAPTVERMLRRRVYTGVAHWGDRENLQAHEPLVDEATFQAVQRRVQTYSKARSGDDVALLHGIVRCAGCRFQMSRALNKSNGYHRQYYRCRVHRSSGRCLAPAAVRADRDDGLEAYVESVVLTELDRLQRTFVDVPDSAELEGALAALEAAQQDLDEMRLDTAARRRLGTRWLDFVEPYITAVEDAQARVDDVRAAAGGEPRIELTAEAYRAMPREARAAALREMIDCIFVRNVGGPRGPQAVPIDEERVRILWRGTGPSDLPAANRASKVVPWPWPCPMRSAEVADQAA